MRLASLGIAVLGPLNRRDTYDTNQDLYNKLRRNLWRILACTSI